MLSSRQACFVVAHSSGDLIRIFFTIVSYIQNNLHNNNNKHISDLCGAKFYSLAIA